MTVRLTSVMLAGLLMRRVQGEGGNAMVLAKGDESAGSILILCAEKGRNTALCERLLEPSGGYAWGKVGPQDIENIEEVDRYIARRRAQDPDLWVIELDTPNAERLIAETGSGA
jgi:hypothetical protein